MEAWDTRHGSSSFSLQLYSPPYINWAYRAQTQQEPLLQTWVWVEPCSGSSVKPHFFNVSKICTITEKNLFLLLLLSAAPFSFLRGPSPPVPASSSVTLTFCMSSVTISMNLLWRLSLFLLPASSIVIILSNTGVSKSQPVYWHEET